MSPETLAGQWIAEHWYLLVAGWLFWRWWATEKRERQKDAEVAAKTHSDAVRVIVREELASHVKDEAETLARFRESIERSVSEVASLVRQHESRLAAIDAVLTTRGQG